MELLLKKVNGWYFCKKLHLRRLTGFWICLSQTWSSLCRFCVAYDAFGSTLTKPLISPGVCGCCGNVGLLTSVVSWFCGNGNAVSSLDFGVFSGVSWEVPGMFAYEGVCSFPGVSSDVSPDAVDFISSILESRPAFSSSSNSLWNTLIK